MENASKALIISGSVLLAIMILSIGVRLQGSFQNTADAYLQSLSTNSIKKYNSHFEVYADPSKTITAQEIVTLVEFAKKTEMGTEVYVKGKTGEYIDRVKFDFDTNQFLKENILYEDDEKIYNSFKYTNNSIEYSQSTGLVSKINFLYVPEKSK